MTPKGPRSERETIINFNEEDDMVSIWTASQPLYRRATTPMCEYCRAQPATEGVYCDKCLLEVVHDMLEGDLIAAYQEGVITKEEYLFIFGPTTAPLTQADEERFAQIMDKVDGWE